MPQFVQVYALGEGVGFGDVIDILKRSRMLAIIANVAE